MGVFLTYGANHATWSPYGPEMGREVLLACVLVLSGVQFKTVAGSS